MAPCLDRWQYQQHGVPEFKAGSQHYQDIALTPGKQQLDAYLNGKESTQDNITHYRTPEVNPQAAEVPPGDFIAESGPVAFRLNSVEALSDSVIWLRYSVQSETA